MSEEKQEYPDLPYRFGPFIDSNLPFIPLNERELSLIKRYESSDTKFLEPGDDTLLRTSQYSTLGAAILTGTLGFLMSLKFNKVLIESFPETVENVTESKLSAQAKGHADFLKYRSVEPPVKKHKVTPSKARLPIRNILITMLFCGAGALQGYNLERTIVRNLSNKYLSLIHI
eukprot:TRINITY_DN16743_c0_g1_i1.p1 TRINITY_DN16743_c0_g1~~TRINITY_DN16743_c0_g1_i1.p1  ORF type:complete len:173 (-),score=20.97 TRINITY_DN16743_c0_g1_i1:56-574(-)